MVASLTLVVSTAVADPVGPPTYRDLAGVGSDTTQGVMDAMSNAITDNSGTKILGSYDAGGGNITTQDPSVYSNCTIPRPAGFIFRKTLAFSAAGWMFFCGR